MGLYQQLIDMLLTVVSCVLNSCIMLLVVSSNREEWRRMDVYVLSLSLVDFLYTLGIPIRTYTSTQTNHNWPFGQIS